VYRGPDAENVSRWLGTPQRVGENTKMSGELNKLSLPRFRILAWLLAAGFFLYLYYTRADLVGNSLRDASAASMFVGYGLYLLLGSIRGLTLIPSTGLLLLAIPLFPPWELFALTLIGILISSLSIYFFSGSLHLAEYFGRRDETKVEKVRNLLERNPLTIIVAWSFFPLAPTDLICYVCGVMRISLGRFLLGVLIGEGAICALYIFLGESALRTLPWRL
jgi:uncharacterized membrane protein YdjX (TVP38/TMEM64 family)